MVWQAGTAIEHGDSNVLTGYQCGDAIDDGYQNVGVGAAVAFANEATAVNQIVIGYGATGTANNEAVIGNASIDKVYMAQDSGATVHCAAVQIADGGNIGSASDTDAMAITAAGSVLFNTISYGSSQQITVANNTTQTITVTNKRVFLYNTHSGAQIQDIAFASNVGGIGAQVFFQLDNSSTQAVSFNEGGNIALSGTTSGLNGKLNGVLVMFYDGAKWLEQSYTALD